MLAAARRLLPVKPTRPLGGKAYGSIGHLPGSRLGPGDHRVHEGQARILTEQPRDRWDTILLQEKLDGSCCVVAKLDGAVLALSRSGYAAQSSRFEHHQLFAHWVREREPIFAGLLDEGERLVGEWLALAHGTRYDATHRDFAPFVVFDIMRGPTRTPWAELVARMSRGAPDLRCASVAGTGATPVADAMLLVATSRHAAMDPVEGVVYRCERKSSVDFLAKYVRPDKVDGCYLPEVSGGEPIWHYRPD